MLGLTDDQQSLARALGEWAVSVDAPGLAKRSETEDLSVWQPVLDGLAEFGVAGIAVPEKWGGAGGSLVDLAVAVEACADGMVPGGVLPTAVAAMVLADAVAADSVDTGAVVQVLPGVATGDVRFAVALRGEITVTDRIATGTSGPALGLGTATHLLAPVEDGGWLVVPLGADGATVADGPVLDLSTRTGAVRLDGVAVAAGALIAVDSTYVEHVAVTLAAAECSGIAAWTMRTAVDYAKVREQFGRTIGSFQSIKHLCAQMFEASESAAAVAWDAAAAHDEGDGDQFALAARAAAAVGLDLAVRNAQDCIQVLGGIGFTWEHHAHLYLRRATTLRQWLGGSDRWRVALADQALAGGRRTPHIDLGPAAEETRASVAADLAAIAALPAAERRAALADAGLIMPHWPAPYGRGAGPVEQIVIDEEYAAAGLVRPSLAIGAWAAPTIAVSGTDAQRERFLRPTLTGEITWCQLFSEPGAGSDLASLRTRAERTEGGWLLSGQKVWTSVAAQADWAICLARTNPDAPQHKGITYFLVDMRSAGLDIRPLRELTGEALFNEVFLDQVFVPDDCVVGEVDGGWPLARTTLANERVAISDSSFGVSVERALRLVGHRDGGPTELDRVRVGDAVGAAATVKALGTRATLRQLAGHGPGAESSVLKLVGVAQRQDSSELALALLEDQLFNGGPEAEGAIGEALVTRCLSIAGGTTQVLRNVAAERILGLPRG